MTVPPEVPQVRARTGQLSVAPDVGDAITGLLLLTLPLVGLLAYTAGSSASPSKATLLLCVAVHAGTSVIAIRGFLSDLTPWRARARFIPLRVLGTGLAYTILVTAGLMFAGLPNSATARQAVDQRIADFESRTSSAASSASSAGQAAPAHTPAPSATVWDRFLESGFQHTIGIVLIGCSLIALGALVTFYVLARTEQARDFPRVRPFDIPDHEID